MIDLQQTYYITSSQRTSGNISNCQIELPIPLEVKPFLSHCSLISANFPKSYYAISDGSNTLTLIEGASTVVVTISAGNYSREQLFAELSTKMTIASANAIVYICTVETSLRETGKMKITATNNLLSLPISIQFIDNDMYYAMGFVKNTINAFEVDPLDPLRSFIISPNCINLNEKSTGFYISSDLVKSAYGSVTTGGGCLAVIYGQLFKNFSYISASFDIIANMKKFTSRTSNVYTFQITNDDNQYLNFHGIDWQITLALFRYTPNHILYKTIDDYIEKKSALMAEIVRSQYSA